MSLRWAHGHFVGFVMMRHVMSFLIVSHSANVDCTLAYYIKEDVVSSVVQTFMTEKGWKFLD